MRLCSFSPVQALESLDPGIFMAGQEYCVAGSLSSRGPTVSFSSLTTSTPTITISTFPTLFMISLSPPSSPPLVPYQPQQTGTATNCDRYYLAETGDTCGKIEAQFDVSTSDWNPGVASATDTQWAGWRSDGIRSTRNSLYKCLAMMGTTDWATGLQKNKAIPGL
ncbi:hypothetical protein M752DRAFT_311695 [Aspergillus phoenicis ATCC 13157]|uniref:LysM domain-containing protein n=1 Tax=Aspergillus phoenicis ATCC 13157 TaxID=1353007 RepID=A0A370PTR4_ASPPH|nr:hypothetical protein M752DRAFT_311695 [Aspergillus phoenicis ATCC 13157]